MSVRSHVPRTAAWFGSEVPGGGAIAVVVAVDAVETVEAAAVVVATEAVAVAASDVTGTVAAELAAVGGGVDELLQAANALTRVRAAISAAAARAERWVPALAYAGLVDGTAAAEAGDPGARELLVEAAELAAAHGMPLVADEAWRVLAGAPD